MIVPSDIREHGTLIVDVFFNFFDGGGIFSKQYKQYTCFPINMYIIQLRFGHHV